MGFTTAIATCFRKYFTISGRAGRSEYWWFVLFLVLLGIGATALDALFFGLGTLDSDFGGPIAAVTNLATFVPSITATVRRLHDTGKPGYAVFWPFAVLLAAYLCIAAIPGTIGLIVVGLTLIGGLGLYLWWLVKPSDPGANRYGPKPTDPHNVEEVFQ